MGMLQQVMAEPRWLTIAGLGLDVIGGVLVAATAWARIQMIGTWDEGDLEPLRTMRGRRNMVLAGGILLSAGFALQMYATWMQMP